MIKLNILLNGNIVEGYEGETILKLSKRHDIEIPTLCNDPRLEPYSSCYLCVVEVEGMRGLQPACSTKISEGMKISTSNDRVEKSRKYALELLASNHYADCVAPCKEECPAGVDVQGYISLIDKGLYSEAVGLIKQTNPLPAICGRVCVRPCELVCRRNLLEKKSVGIDYLKRYTSDKDLQSKYPYSPVVKDKTGKRVAIIGAGPGGLTAAYYLAVEGHSPEIFEASPKPGGMLRYGIPPYRLPDDIIDKEVEAITKLGVKIHYNKKLGGNTSYKDLKEEFDSVVLAIGSQNGTRIGCENDDAGNIFPGIEFLRNMQMSGQKYDFTGKKVAVIGGGNTAMDCCRTSMRCGADEVKVLYRRTEKEMPANPIEIHESKLEGIEYMFLTAPAKVNKDKDGNVKSLTCFEMKLGEPDASGRRRPVKIEGSEFDVEVDYILAAIGQKTVVDFVDDINQSGSSELKLNKWGDIDADPGTLQTSIASVFACGDGVTGPATLIEAIAQGRIAAMSCSQFLTGEKLSPVQGEFLSKKDNFEEQVANDYKPIYKKQNRKEMPVLNPAKRKNFDEVELGYSDDAAKLEAQRCLECGCSELYYCDLKKYSTQYKIEQKGLMGDFKNHYVDFSHPFIEIDNNKCVLCGRCIRICKEVVGANALGYVNRGFETYVAPSMDGKLKDTKCESCGMCISACPTGAITENVTYKPGPFNNNKLSTICNYCSIGCEIALHHKGPFFNRVTGNNGLVNKNGNICRYPRFGYRYLNDESRIKKPLLKENGEFREISFKEAFDIIIKKIKQSSPGENAFYAGARLTNEEIYMINKLAREGAGTGFISSFHYEGRGDGYHYNSHDNVPFDQIMNAGRLYLLGIEPNYENGVLGYDIYNSAYINNIPLELIDASDDNRMAYKAARVHSIKSYYHFVKAVNYCLVSNEMYNKVYLDSCYGFEDYCKDILSENFKKLINLAGVTEDELLSFCKEYYKEEKAIIIFGEKNLSANTCLELRNMALISGKLGKTASGIISVKEKNNSQGIIDINESVTRYYSKNNSFNEKNELVGLENPGSFSESVGKGITWNMITQGRIKNLFIFGEDPLGCTNITGIIQNALTKPGFKVIQDYFMTETAKECDLVLPASLPFETGGSFTNTQKYIQQFDALYPCQVEKSNFEQLAALQRGLGIESIPAEPVDAFNELAEIISTQDLNGKEKKLLVYTVKNNFNRVYNYGCDYIVKRFEEEFKEAF